MNLQAKLSLFDVFGGGSIHALASRIADISKAAPRESYNDQFLRLTCRNNKLMG